MWVRFLCIGLLSAKKVFFECERPSPYNWWPSLGRRLTRVHRLPCGLGARQAVTITKKKRKEKKRTQATVSHRVSLLCWSSCWCCRLVSIGEPWCTAFAKAEWERQDWEKKSNEGNGEGWGMGVQGKSPRVNIANPVVTMTLQKMAPDDPPHASDRSITSLLWTLWTVGKVHFWQVWHRPGLWASSSNVGLIQISQLPSSVVISLSLSPLMKTSWTRAAQSPSGECATMDEVSRLKHVTQMELVDLLKQVRGVSTEKDKNTTKERERERERERHAGRQTQSIVPSPVATRGLCG